MNTTQALLERYRRAKESKKADLSHKLKVLDDKIRQKNPFAFSYKPFSQTKNKYEQLLNKRDRIDEQLDYYHNTENENIFQKIVIYFIDIAVSLWFIVFILYRNLTEHDYFVENMPDFIIQMVGEENAIIFMMVVEALMTIAFSFLMSQMAKSDLSYKRYFFIKKLFIFCSVLFIIAIVSYIYLSSN